MIVVEQQTGAGPSSRTESEPVVPAQQVDTPAPAQSSESQSTGNPFVLRIRKLGRDLRDNWHGFRRFMWNREKGEVMGRNRKSWGKSF